MGLKIKNYMMRIHDEEVNNIAECHLLHDIINPPKLTKNLNIHYSPIPHGCMNTKKGKEKFKNFRILLYSGCSSTIVMRGLVEKLNPDQYYVMQRHTQASNITTNIKVKVDFTLPALSVTNVVMWECHADDSTKDGYYMILGRDLLREL